MGIIEILNAGSAETGRGFLVIGGYAVNNYGYSRLTVDLDVLINKDHREFWKQLILKNGYTVYCERDSFLQFTPEAKEQVPVDFMLVNERTFSRMYGEAVDGLLGGASVKFPSLPHLIALKLHVIKQALPHRELRDLDDVLQLVQRNKVDTGTEEFKQLCEKHGNSTIYEAIVRANR